MFLFIVGVLQHFKFTIPDDEKIITDPKKFNMAAVIDAFDYNVKIEARQ